MTLPDTWVHFAHALGARLWDCMFGELLDLHQPAEARVRLADGRPSSSARLDRPFAIIPAEDIVDLRPVVQAQRLYDGAAHRPRGVAAALHWTGYAYSPQGGTADPAPGRAPPSPSPTWQSMSLGRATSSRRSAVLSSRAAHPSAGDAFGRGAAEVRRPRSPLGLLSGGRGRSGRCLVAHSLGDTGRLATVAQAGDASSACVVRAAGCRWRRSVQGMLDIIMRSNDSVPGPDRVPPSRYAALVDIAVRVLHVLFS